MAFTNEVCVLCENEPSTPSGDHSLPKWLLEDRFPVDEYTLERNGHPELKRDQVTPRTHDAFPRVTLPVGKRCNKTLNQRFEEPAKPLVRRVLNARSNVTLAPAEAIVFALWTLKTWLLLAHPQGRQAPSRLIHTHWDLDLVDHDLYGWMVSGEPPPDVVSAWITRASMTEGEGTPRRIALPTIQADGKTIKFQALLFTLESIEVNLVYHPHWPIDFPLEHEERAARLWPRDSTSSLDLAALPLVSGNDTNWLVGPRLTFEPGTYGSVQLEPLSSEDGLFVDRAPIVVVNF